MNPTIVRRLTARYRTKLRRGRMVFPPGRGWDRQEYLAAFCKLNFLTHS